MLRHYDKLGLLMPNEVDEWTGYRYYTIDQLSRLHRIIALKELGLSLQQVGELLDGREMPSAENLRGMLQLKQAELQREMEEMQHRLVTVESRLLRIEQEGKPSPYEIVVKSIEPQPIASIRITVPDMRDMGQYCASTYRELYKRIDNARIKPAGSSMILYHAEDYRETDIEVETSVCVSGSLLDGEYDGLRLRELPTYERVAALIYEGPLNEMGRAILSLLDWVGRNNHAPTGPLREIHVGGLIHRTVEETNTVVELQLPIRPTTA